MYEDIYKKKTFPAILLTEGKNALVVGGGKIATRKVNHLLDSQMNVFVVSPTITDEIEALVDDNKIDYKSREFLNSDISGMTLVFAATSDRSVNRQIIHECKDAGILCCSSDGNWRDGDFITPAIYRDQSLTLTVSTDGKACRKSRLVKNILAKQTNLIEDADLLVLGTDHYHLDEIALSNFKSKLESDKERSEMVSSIVGVHEFMFLDTCNRVEVYALVSKSSNFEKIVKRILGFDLLSDNECYTIIGDKAFDHLATLSSGLNSQLKGEHHIVSQIKEAFKIAHKNHWANGTIKEWVDSALYVSKKIRTINHNTPVSTASSLIAYLKEKKITPENVSLIGSGEVGYEVLKELCNKYKDIELKWFYHQRVPTNNHNNVKMYKISELENEMEDSELIISATTSSDYLVKKENISEKNRILIDLSIPRNIDPEITNSNHASLISLRDLNSWQNSKNTATINDVEEILNSNRELYEKIISSFKNR